MKRKRGSKKGHKKGKTKESIELDDPASAAVSINAEDDFIDHNDNSQHDSDVKTEAPAVRDDKPGNISSFESDPAMDSLIGKTGPARLKVKLRSSRPLDVQATSDTDKSNHKATLEVSNAPVEKEDSTYSDGQTSEMHNNISEMVPKKAGSIKIKSSSLLLSNEDNHEKKLKRPNSPSLMLSGRGLVLLDDEKPSDLMLVKSLQKVETKQPYMDAHHSEKELSAALAVIKKVMKMDAAEPFNAPVDPDALGIPDYFDIIDTPMDFGTICRELEHGSKYLNSEGVYKDVQLIWENCYKYNNKGDYIVDLMKRVKKNFTKYWMAAGLFLDKPSNGATERSHMEDGIRPSQDKFHSKGKQKYKRRRHGIDLHKSDCLCAVCVVRRRRKERETNSSAIEKQAKLSNGDLPREFSIEGSSPVNHEYSEDATSSQDHSQEADANADFEEAEDEEKETAELIEPDEPLKQDAVDVELETLPHGRGSREASLNLPSDNGAGEDSSRHSLEQDLDLGFVTETGDEKDDTKVRQQEPGQKRICEESAERSQQHVAVEENSSMEENHSVLQIGKSLFPSSIKSVWNGPHSLMRRHVPLTRDTPLHLALASFMKS